VSANYPPITNWRIANGRSITAEDESKADLVVVIGQTVYRQLFSPFENPIGAIIQVKSVPLRVVGVLAAKGQSPFGQDQDDIVMTPFSTAERKVLGVAAPSQQQVPIYRRRATNRLRKFALRATAKSLHDFLSTTHASVTMSSLTDDEMRKIISFIISLRDKR
jgi:ABC-type antimicrobial peptide transport system permease subunit